MKFKTGKNKQIQFGFGASGLWAEEYKRVVGHYHTGVDYFNGYGSPVISDNYGIVYKIALAKDSASGWQGVYYLCPDDKYGWVEVCQGHLSKINVKVGDLVRENQVVGLEGNKGEVYENGVRITKAMQEAGDKRGSHVHEQFRPLTKVAKRKSTKHYINTSDGKPYQDKSGNYYEITFTNDTRGCVNPYEFLVQKNSLPVEFINKLLDFIQK
jgi:murein DD-endopeptidase MepM/ murein hydrolase activator NlpD